MYDIIIIGAGAAGLMSALKLCQHKKVLILEANDRIGGRIQTVYNTFSIPAEMGAEFIHGETPFTLALLKHFKIAYTEATGEIWKKQGADFIKEGDFIEDGDLVFERLKGLKEDISVQEFLDTYFNGEQYKELNESITRYTEGLNAADVSRASAFELRHQLNAPDEGRQYRAEGGYQRLIDAMYDECIFHDCKIELSSPVTSIEWVTEHAEVSIADGKKFTARQVLITVPLGVLASHKKQDGAITFTPPIAEKINTAKKLGNGSIIKILLEFDTPFWSDYEIKNFFFLFTQTAIPTWWTQEPIKNSLLTGWLPCTAEPELQNKTDDEILHLSLISLCAIFNIPVPTLQARLKNYAVNNWWARPYAMGSYSYITPQTKAGIQLLSKPVENTLFFAGEGLNAGLYSGTVEAAFESAMDAVKQILG